MAQCTLETLATEIKFCILKEITDIATLDALVHASPVYHAAYLSQRKYILHTLLSRTIQLPVLSDALGVVVETRQRSRRAKGITNAPRSILNFMAQYAEVQGQIKGLCAWRVRGRWS